MMLVYLLVLAVVVGYLRGGRLNGYLQKPLNQEQLLELLFKLLPSEKVKVKA